MKKFLTPVGTDLWKIFPQIVSATKFYQCNEKLCEKKKTKKKLKAKAVYQRNAKSKREFEFYCYYLHNI